jgi:ribonuclease HII
MKEIKDSKKLSKKKRQLLAEFIKETCIDYSIHICDNHEIDNTNILQETLKGMHSCTTEILKKNHTIDLILVDGNHFTPVLNPYHNNDEDSLMIIPYKTIPNGDNIWTQIAAASILAKVYHDNLITEISNNNPSLNDKYAILSNMGYGTKKHIEGIQKHGISNFHRKTFLSKILPHTI